MLCEGLFLLGEYERARKLTDKLLPLAENAGFEGQKAGLLRISAEIDLHLPNPNWKAIKQQLDDALKLSTQLEMLPNIGHCHLAMAKLYQQMENNEESEKALEAALRIYKQLDMPYWIEQCEQAGFLSRG